MSSSTSSSEVTRRRPAIRCALFVALAAGAVLLTGELLEATALRLDPNVPKIREMLALRGETNDVVYLGNSVVLEAANPEVVEQVSGLRGYNLASGGQTLLESRLILQHYLANNRKPSVVALGLFVNGEADQGMNPEIYFHLPRKLQAFARREDEISGLSPIDRGYRVWGSIKAYRYRASLDHFIKYVIAGEGRIPRFVRGHLALDFSRAATITPSLRHTAGLNRDALGGVLDLCAEHQIPVLLFEPPDTPGYTGVTTGRDWVLASIAAQVARHPVTAFVSFNDGSVVYPADEWVGLNHLNARGAERFSREQLGPALKAFSAQ